jgi:hypothetical protein
MKLSAEGGQAKPVAANAMGLTRGNLLSMKYLFAVSYISGMRVL